MKIFIPKIVDFFFQICLIIIYTIRKYEFDMREKRFSERYAVFLPVKVQWKDEKGEEVIEEGRTEHIGQTGVLVHLLRRLPEVGTEVDLTVSENDSKELAKVKAQVLRLERNAADPKCTLLLTEASKEWEEKVWQYAAKLVSSSEEEPEEDW